MPDRHDEYVPGHGIPGEDVDIMAAGGRVDSLDAIIVADQFVVESIQMLGAEVDGDVWRMEEGGQSVTRTRVPYDQYFPHMVINGGWVAMRGLNCVESKRGDWLKVRSARTRKIIRYYRVPEDACYCQIEKDAKCYFIRSRVVDGEFWRRKPKKDGTPRGDPLIETREIWKCVKSKP